MDFRRVCISGFAAIFALALAGGARAADPPAACGIGKEWDVVDVNGGWNGVWTRRGDTQTFDAVWRRVGSDETVSAVLDFSVNGNDVSIQRTDTPNAYKLTGCAYTGTLSADGATASGTVTCDTAAGAKLGPFKWRAAIRCQAETPVEPSQPGPEPSPG